MVEGFPTDDGTIVLSPRRYGRYAEPSPADLKALADSIALNGQTTPGIVRQADSHLELLVGHNRYYALRILNCERSSLDQLLFYARRVVMDSERAFQIAVAENHIRKMMSDLDLAEAVHRMSSEC